MSVPISQDFPGKDQNFSGCKKKSKHGHAVPNVHKTTWANRDQIKDLRTYLYDKWVTGEPNRGKMRGLSR